MTREEFIKILEKEDYSYEIEGDKIIVTYKGIVGLGTLTSLPPGVEFMNEGSVYLDSLTSLHPGVVFRNGRDVDLDSLTSIPHDVEFKNGGNVYLRSLETIPPGMEFKNGVDVYLGRLTGDWFSNWSGNIEGIDSKRLLNVMIKKSMFI